MSDPAPEPPAETPAATPAVPEPLVPLTVTDLAQLFANNRASVIDGITKHAYGEIVSYVGKGLTSFRIYHPLLQTSWMADAQFVTDMLAAVQTYFPGTSITFVGLGEANGIPYILFSYTPTP
jgi:hypothetical protein